MDVYQLIAMLRQAQRDYGPGVPKIYVYDENHDHEREVVDVGVANANMPRGIVISIRGGYHASDK